MDNIKACEDFIIRTFKEHGYRGIETNLLFKMAEEAGLYVKDSYGSDFSKALSNTVDIQVSCDIDGDYLYSVFILKKGD